MRSEFKKANCKLTLPIKSRALLLDLYPKIDECPKSAAITLLQFCDEHDSTNTNYEHWYWCSAIGKSNLSWQKDLFLLDAG